MEEDFHRIVFDEQLMKNVPPIIKPEEVKENDEPAEMEEKIKKSRIEDYEIKETRSDGNCLYRSILNAAEMPEEAHKELRIEVADMVEKSQLQPAVFSEQGCKNKDEYAGKVRGDKFFGGYIEMQILAREWNVWFAIYLSDERYAQTRWNIIKGSEERKPRKILTLKLTQGQIVNRDIDGHYDSMKPKKGVLWGSGLHGTMEIIHIMSMKLYGGIVDQSKIW